MGPNKDREFLVHFICESDAIERIEDDPALIRTQLRNKNIRGHVGAFNYLRACAEKRELVTADMIKKVQRLIVSEQPKKGAHKLAKGDRGHWRTRNVWVGGRLCEDPIFVASYMLAHVANIAHWQKTFHNNGAKENIEIIARLHLQFLIIHPFIDGNGRTSRALAYYLYIFAGLPPLVFTAHDRYETYYPCFADPQDPSAMKNYFLTRSALVTL